MKRNFLSFAILLSAMVLFASCLGDSDDENVTYYGDTAITSFSLGTLKTVVHSTSSTGADSVSYPTIAGSNYKFYIDQINRVIYNQDSLPSNVDASAVLATIAAKNSGTVVIKAINSDTLYTYSSTDSIDFTVPREIRAYAQDGSTYRSYTVNVNIHKQKSGEFNWETTSISNQSLAALTAMKAVSFDHKIFVFGNNADGAKVYATSENTTSGWQEITPNVSLSNEAYKNVAVKDNKLYLLNNGQLLSSADGASWNTVAAAADLVQLVGATSNKLYALTANGISSSADGSVWNSDNLDDNSSLLPSENVALLSTVSRVNANVNQLVLVGNRAESFTADDAAYTWGTVEEAGNSWYCYNAGNRKPAPRLNNLQVINYGDKLLAFGGDGIGACSKAAFDGFYQSEDAGLSWQTSVITAPYGLSSSKTAFTIVSDSNKYLWLICGESGQVWRGRLSDYGWDK